MRSILENILAVLARQIIQKYQPIVVGITGSTGKTTTRRAVVSALAKRFRVYTPPRNLNDKLGLPLGVIGLDTPGKSVWGWFMVIVKAMFKIVRRVRYPEVLVLEYGIDRVGEMDQLLAVATPKIGILTGIGLSHYEFFQNPETIEQEKGKLLEAVEAGGLCLVNGANLRAVEVGKRSKAPVVEYGSMSSPVRVAEVHEDFNQMASHVKLVGAKNTYNFSVKALGTPHISALLAGVAVAEELGVEKQDLEEGLASYLPMPGRLNLLPALKKSWLLDDTYNSAPDSIVEALNLFARLPSSHKIAVLGDMKELGALSDTEHEKVGKLVADINPKHLVTVGPGGKVIADSAKANGYPESSVLAMDNAQVAALAVHDLVEEGSVILVKASQSMRFEIVSKEVLAEPMKARDLLCRQDARWLEKK